MGVCLIGQMASGFSEVQLLAAATWVQWIIQPSSWSIILQVALGLGFVIFVHELGHFLVAKACGVKCEKFFLGFDVGGLKLLSFTWGETEYGIGCLPLGGYVKMLGQDDNPAAAAKEAERARALLASGDLPPEPVDGPHPAWDPRSYPAQSVPKRMAIISAGVIMNVIFAVLMASWAFRLGVKELTCEVSSVRPGGAAWRAGLQTGDVITAIGNIPNPIFSDLQKGVTLGNVAEGIEFTIHRQTDDSTRTLRLYPDTDLGVPTVGVTSPFSLSLPKDLPKDLDGDLAKGLQGSAGRAQPSFVAGDTIRLINGVAVQSYAELIAVLSEQGDATVKLTVDRLPTTGKPGNKNQQAQPPETITIEIPPQKMRSTGLCMTAMPIKAVQADAPAARAGMRAGDRLLAIEGKALGDPLTIDQRLRDRIGKKVMLTLVRSADKTDGDKSLEEGQGSQTLEVEVEPRAVSWIEESRWPSSPVAISTLGVAIGVDAIVAEVAAGSPAAAAGILPGERVVRVRFDDPDQKENGPKKAAAQNGLEISSKSPSWPYIVSVMQQVPEGTKMQLEVEAADGVQREVELLPVDSQVQFVVDRGLVFEPVYKVVRADSFLAALKQGSRKAYEDLSLVYRFLQKLTSNQISPRLLGGPIEIAKQAGKSAEEGFGRLLLFLTMLSANLAVVNFLPIPVLDGGHMVFLVYEWVRGKPPSEGVVVVLSYLGLALILTLMLFVFGLDLGLIPRR
ncbi:MAG: site-2 protease family protein [Planctomycetia bacterium]|nr:site-2 protease family protein [Planctomycetia bacterium]